MRIPDILIKDLNSLSPGNRVLRLRGLSSYYRNPRYCLFCNKVINAVPGVRLARTKAKKFCNQRCAALYNNKRKLSNECLYCGKSIYKYRKYCSHKCVQEHKYRTYIGKWLSGKVSGIKGKDSISNYIRRWLIDKYNNRCVKCGWSVKNRYTNKVPLQINHIDGNWKNNKSENLELVCPNCHSLTPNYGGRNKGKGRPYRYKMRV